MVIKHKIDWSQIRWNIRSGARQARTLAIRHSRQFAAQARKATEVFREKYLPEIQATLAESLQAASRLSERMRHEVSRTFHGLRGDLQDRSSDPRSELPNPEAIGIRIKPLSLADIPQPGASISLTRPLASETAKSPMRPGIRPIQSPDMPCRFKNILIVGGMEFFGAALVHQLNATGFRDITITSELHAESCRSLCPLYFREFLTPEEYEEISKSRFRQFSDFSHIFYLRSWGSSTFGQAKSLFAAANKVGTRFIAVSPATALGPWQAGASENRGNPDFFRPLTQEGLMAGLFDRHMAINSLGKYHLSLKHHLLFGPGEPEDGGLGGFIKRCHGQIHANRSIRLPAALKPGSLELRRRFDFLPVQEAAQLALFLAQNHQTAGVYELGSGVSATAGEFVDATLHACGRPKDIVWDEQLEYVPPSPQPEQAWLGRLAETSWKSPVLDLQAAVARYVKSYLEPSLSPGGEPQEQVQPIGQETPEPSVSLPQRRRKIPGSPPPSNPS